MTDISRREFIKQSAADVAAAAAFVPFAARELMPNPLGMPIGSQTWPHRQRIKDGMRKAADDRDEIRLLRVAWRAASPDVRRRFLAELQASLYADEVCV